MNSMQLKSRFKLLTLNLFDFPYNTSSSVPFFQNQQKLYLNFAKLKGKGFGGNFLHNERRKRREETKGEGD